MHPANKFQDYKFNGKGAYSQQLDHVSLVDGYDDTFVGLNAGTKVILGGSSQQNTAVGANSMTSSQTVSNTTIVGAYGGAEIQNSESSVGVGTGVLEYGANIVGHTAVGYQSAQRIEKSSYNTSVGWKTMGRFVQGERNVAIGAAAA